jgi:hypothetical protein
MADETQPPADPNEDDTTETGGADAAPVESFPSPDEFENFDDVDSTTVELPDDSFDASAVVEGEDSEGCGVQ